ncbi:hypothetical protein RZS08_16345, partial [Arthrospira platensis SPKY1]|nr:hypothetical protein [Arthrospira platensis SPKY1]
SVPFVWKDGKGVLIDNDGHTFKINSSNVMIGSFGSFSPTGGIPFYSYVDIDDNSGEPEIITTSLLSFSISGYSSTGWTIEAVWDINDNNQIVGWGINSSGKRKAFLLNPTAEWAAINNNRSYFASNVVLPDVDNLHELWKSGENGENPAPIDVDGNSWEYSGVTYNDRSIG